MLRVLIADDDPNVRTTLVRWLSFQRDLEVAGEAADGREAMDQALALSPDVIVMDARMPRLSGVEAIKALRAGGVATPVLVFSADDSAEDDIAGLEAVSFLSKGAATPRSTADAIRAAATDGDHP